MPINPAIKWTARKEEQNTGGRQERGFLTPDDNILKQYADRLRRMSTLSRSDAIQGYQPIKQVSNPLPQHPRIYERGHEHSRSWNVETGRESSPPLQNDYNYYQRNEIYPEERTFIPVINEPSNNHLSVRQFPRQAKSFDERSGSPRDMRRMSTDRRTVSLTRQSTAQHLQPETPVAAACQSLWAAKGHLEELHALGISDPSSASTSFESNTDNSPAPGNGAAGKAREEGADKKRMQYKSLFLRRKFLSTAAVSSMDSTNSTESSAPEAIFASSVDSAGSDLEHRRLSLLNRIPTGSVPHLNTRPYPNINPPPTSHRRRLNNRENFSVDAQSDTLFREWSRVDPAYEERDLQERRDTQNSRRLGRGVSEDQALRPSRARVYSRQLTVNPGGNPLIPYIRYPDEMNCPR
ncbi:unnamed protein product [Cylicocyclus nassatus]|uniref:Uncharacterized protein n=1 Tax=Cylicocyclus nassatus TaxID=53992 RepID=A0AA36HCG2_CYLNA|nr:unnamed protein product [Cylicocyclus nassatus]